MPNQRNAKCPHCGEEIDYVSYSHSVVEYGTATFCFEGNEVYENDRNCDGSDSNDSPAYFCPECHGEISLDELTVFQDDDEDSETNDHGLLEDGKPHAHESPKEPSGGPFICTKCHEWCEAEDYNNHVKKPGATSYYCEACLNP